MGSHSPDTGDSRSTDPKEPPAELLERVRIEGGPALDEICAQRPEFADALRRRHQEWQRAGRALERLGLSPPEGAASSRGVSPSGASPPTALGWDRYTIGSEIGRGGMGSILAVHDEDLGRELAMKVMRDRWASPILPDKKLASPGRRARFLEEARITGRLQHPNIVPVHELGSDPEDRPYFTMKLVEGRTLRDVFQAVATGDEGWTLERALGVLLKVCEAVGFAHDKEIVHRDLKPANLMVGSFGEVYVMDWGLARDLARPEPEAAGGESPDEREAEQEEGLRTRDGDVLGTPEYMSPEQAGGRREAIGPQADVFAMGAMLYELLTGQTPYGKRGSSTPQVRLAAAIGATPTEVRQLNPKAPAELCAICERAIASELGARYGTMMELAEDLRAYLEGRVVRAHATGALAEFRKWVHRNRAVASLAALFFLAVVVGLGVISVLALRISDQKADLEIKTAEAERTAKDVMRLAAAQDHEDLVAKAHTLWPITPELIPELQQWIGDSDELVALLPAFRGKRDELRARALPLTEEERQVQRESHSEYGRLAPLQAELASRALALAVREDRAEVELPEVEWSEYPQEASALSSTAWRMVDPEREIFGREALGLVLSQRAAELASPAELPVALDACAWGHFGLGDDEGALASSREALERSGEEERESYDYYLRIFEAAVAGATSEAGLAQEHAELAELEEEAAALSARLEERSDWRFPSESEGEIEARWWHNQLTLLITDLEALVDPQHGLSSAEGVSIASGWSVPRRLAFAQRLREGGRAKGEFRERWEAALPALRERYAGLELTPQAGLVPIGPDPDSGLWEFWHVQSGTEPLRDGEGRLIPEETSGLVLVLLPGDEFLMGSQREDPDGPNYDPAGTDDESPVHRVELSPFFLSKYEMTQGQWQRLLGANPSFYGPTWLLEGHQHDLTHPVEQMSWFDCAQVMDMAGLSLPSEAQWEYGARAGTQSVWWSGDERGSLRTTGAANLADQSATRVGAAWADIKAWPDLDDGQPVHSPVGSFAANPFGLHDVHGNVWEWCQDNYSGPFYRKSPTLDPLNPPGGSEGRVARGGGYTSAATNARVANRDLTAPGRLAGSVGLRPARALEH